MPPKTTLDQAYHIGMFMMKAVLDGRATELIDLAKVNLSPLIEHAMRPRLRGRLSIAQKPER